MEVSSISENGNLQHFHKLTPSKITLLTIVPNLSRQLNYFDVSHIRKHFVTIESGHAHSDRQYQITHYECDKVHNNVRCVVRHSSAEIHNNKQMV